MKHKIFLVGLPGSGKTTLGMELALHLGIPFIDLDQEIEKATKQPIRQIFAEKGESHFRQLEHQHLKKIIAEMDEYVLATGGGAPCFFNNMELMNATGKTIFINTPIDQIKARIQQDSSRPLMQTNTLEDLQAKRSKWYLQARYRINNAEALFRIFDL